MSEILKSDASAMTSLAEDPHQPFKIYVDGLNERIAEHELSRQLKSHFEKFGPVVDLKILKNRSLNSRRKALRLRQLRR